MRAVYGETAFLFTGDIEKESETEIVATTAELNATIVKVPHHGSRTSSTQAMIGAVGAKIVVIPVGRRSLFGHPHPEVVERWRAAGAIIKTTGEKGTITFSTDGGSLDSETYLP